MKRFLPIGVLLACGIAFALGLLHLFQMRFEAGDVYPAYSSLRADPLGTMAFFESLERLPGVAVRRDLVAANRLPAGRDTTYLHLAADPDDWQRLPEDLFHEIETFLFGGGRLVIAFFPQTTAPSAARLNRWEEFAKTNRPAGAKKSSPPEKSAKKKPPVTRADEQRSKPMVRLKDRWGVEFGWKKLEQQDDATYAPVTVTNRSGLPLTEPASWHSGSVLTNLAPAWRVILARDGQAVVAERAVGRGSIVLATDSFFLSNEALRTERHPALLAWLVGGNRHVVFDEAHLGIAEEPGVAALVRKYRLHGVVVALLALAGLFLWKNAFSLAPPYDDERSADYVAGKESAAGFVSLLRRSVPSRDVLAVCAAEWKKTCGRGVPAAKREQIQAVLDAENVLPPRQRDPVRAYERIARIVSKRSEFRVSSSELESNSRES